MKILLLSDTHGYMDEQILSHARGCDEIWHAGDFGTEEVVEQLEKAAPLRGVFGNIDGPKIRQRFPEINLFAAGGLKVMMIHIGGYPGRYAPKVKSLLMEIRPAIFISGHSHIVKVMRDNHIHGMLHINPGAAGREGFHTVRTLVKFEILNLKTENLQVVELGPRSEREKLPDTVGRTD